MAVAQWRLARRSRARSTMAWAAGIAAAVTGVASLRVAEVRGQIQAWALVPLLSGLALFVVFQWKWEDAEFRRPGMATFLACVVLAPFGYATWTTFYHGSSEPALVIAYDVRTGHRVWQHETAITGYLSEIGSTPNGTVVVMGDRRHGCREGSRVDVEVDPVRGRVLRTVTSGAPIDLVPTPNPNAARVTPSGDTVAIVNGHVVVAGSDQRIRWRAAIPDYHRIPNPSMAEKLFTVVGDRVVVATPAYGWTECSD